MHAIVPRYKHTHTVTHIAINRHWPPAGEGAAHSTWTLSEVGEFLGALFCRRDVQWFFIIRVEVARITGSFRLGQKRRLHLAQHHQHRTLTDTELNIYSI